MPEKTHETLPEHLHSAALAELDPVVLYRLLRLRTDVFVVEQHCAYPELDGRDIEPGSLMVWASSGAADDAGAEVSAVLRVLRDESALRIGRVTAHPSFRGSGLAGRLFAFALEQCACLAPELPIVLDAQEPLERWYGGFGFVRAGETFVEDDIPHVPMRRDRLRTE